MNRLKMLIVSLIFVATSAFALGTDAVSQAGFGDLSSQQQAEIIKSIADKNAQKTDVQTVDEAQKWVNLGASIGKGLAGSARELGMAVNDFANTDAGKLTTMLIVWNVLGHDIIHIVGGLLFIIVGMSAVTYMYIKAYPTSYEYFENGKVKSKNPRKTDDASPWVIVYLVVLGIGIIIFIL